MCRSDSAVPFPPYAGAEKGAMSFVKQNFHTVRPEAAVLRGVQRAAGPLAQKTLPAAKRLDRSVRAVCAH